MYRLSNGENIFDLKCPLKFKVKPWNFEVEYLKNGTR